MKIGLPVTIDGKSMMLPDLEVRVKEWSSVGPYLPIKPFA